MLFHFVKLSFPVPQLAVLRKSDTGWMWIMVFTSETMCRKQHRIIEHKKHENLTTFRSKSKKFEKTKIFLSVYRKNILKSQDYGLNC